MRKGVTEAVFILDRRGSMAGLVSDTVSAFSDTIEEQRKEEGEARVFTVLFSNNSKVVHGRVDIQKTPNLTDK